MMYSTIFYNYFDKLIIIHKLFFTSQTVYLLMFKLHLILELERTLINRWILIFFRHFLHPAGEQSSLDEFEPLCELLFLVLQQLLFVELLVVENGWHNILFFSFTKSRVCSAVTRYRIICLILLFKFYYRLIHYDLIDVLMSIKTFHNMKWKFMIQNLY